MSVQTCFAYHDELCIIFDDNCPYTKIKDCDFYYSKRRSFPDGFKSYMEIVNMLAQARAIKSQKKFNKYILILSTIAIIISVFSFIISLIIQ